MQPSEIHPSHPQSYVMSPVSPRWPRRFIRTMLAVAGASVVGATPAAAQMAGLPTLQNAFTSPGLAAAVNYGSSDAFRVVGLAGAWTSSSNRFQLTGGLAILSPDGEGDRATGVATRATVPIRTRFTGRESSFGAALFAGIGGAWRSGGGLLEVPVGGTASYRRRVGEARALSVYIAPYFQWTRLTGAGLGDSTLSPVDADTDRRDDSDLIRASIGLDFLATSRLSVSLGYDFGASADVGRPGPTGGIFGAGLGVSF